MASGRLSSLLALDIELAGRAPANRDRIARADPADEHGEPALGCATYPRRTAQAWIQRRSINRRQVHGQTTGATHQGWRTFLRNHAPDIAAMDLFVVPTI